MAKRKAARASKRKRAGKRPAASRARRGVTARRKRAARKATGSRTRATARKAARKTATRKASRKSARKVARKTARKTASKTARKPKATRKAARKTTRKTARKTAAPRAPVRKAPAIERERRTIREEGLFESVPSSLDFDRPGTGDRASRHELETPRGRRPDPGSGITGGDVDADWESAFNVGDEAPGGDNPTPDQDIVDDIGRAVGVRYDDNEELKGERKISDRDKKRWEMDPASSDDYDDR